MSELNPYAPPATGNDSRANPELEPGRHVVRNHRHVLVGRKRGRLPDCCVVCNAPGSGERIREDMTWHPTWVYASFLIGIFFYWILASIMRTSISLDFSLCEEHRKRRANGQLVTWLGAVSAGLIFAVGFLGDFILLTLLGILIALVVPVTGMILARTTRPVRLDEHYIHLKVGDAFLASIRQRVD